MKYKSTELRKDFRKNFAINVPKNWKTQLYYDSQTSEIFIADTTKQLNETFILSASFINHKLKIDSTFIRNHSQKIENQHFNIVNSKSIIYRNKPAYWAIFKGVKNNRELHRFTFFIELSENTYFTTNTDVYGNKNIEKRICESASIIEKITFYDH